METEIKTAKTGVGTSHLVWDFATRTFHWLLAGLFATSWWTAENGYMQAHKIAGLGILGLLVFRFYWGFLGSTTSRFASFIAKPQTVRIYAKSLMSGNSPSIAGHNPMGGWSALAMLVLLSLQVGLGLFAVDVDGLESGPLSHFLNFRNGRFVAKLHGIVFNILWILIFLHICAVLFYVFAKKENLVIAMITGRKKLNLPIDTSPLTFVGGWRATAGILLGVLAVLALASGLRF